MIKALRLSLLLLMAGCGVEPVPDRPPLTKILSTAPVKVKPLASCYVTDLGAWDPAVTAEGERFWSIPHTVKLTTTVPERFPEYFLIEPVVYDENLQRKRGIWQIHEERIRVSWGDGFTSIGADLVLEKGDLVGTAETFEDGNITLRRHARLVLKRIECPRTAA